MTQEERVYSWRYIANRRLRNKDLPFDLEENHDGHEEALILSEHYALRGMVIGQVCQIEDLLGQLVSEREARAIACDHARPSQEHRNIENALEEASRTFCELGLCKKYEDELSLVAWAIEYREILASTTLACGFSRLGDWGPLEHVVTIESTIQGKEEKELPCPPDVDEEWFDMKMREPNPHEYREILQHVHRALESAVDLWQAFDEALPERPVRRLF